LDFAARLADLASFGEQLETQLTAALTPPGPRSTGR
jgi:hypothetical protein